MKRIVLFLVFILGVNVYGQIIVSDGNEPIKISDEPIPSQSKYKPIKDALKVDLTGVVFGKYGIYYERELVPLLSIEVGAGLTFFDISELIFSQLPDKSFVTNKQSFSLPDYRWRNIFKSSPGYFLQVSPKIYLRNNGFEGFYLGVGGSYSRWNYKERFDEGSYFAGSMQNRTGGSLFFGYQKFGGKLCVDMTVGMAVYKNNAKAALADGGEFEFSYTSFSNVLAVKIGPVFRKKIEH